MTYELAKELKDAGFVHEHILHGEEGYEYCQSSKWFQQSEEYICIPTLSELIDACDNDFGELMFLVKERGDDIEDDKGWWATSKSHGRLGSTPEEAIARLWLALNKKV